MTDSADDDMKIPPALIKRWMKEFDRLGLEIEKLEKRRASVRSLIEAASPFAPIPIPATVTPEPASKKRQYRVHIKRGSAVEGKPAASPVRADKPQPEMVIPATSERRIPKIRALNRDTWSSVILKILAEANGGPVSYPELREGIMKTSFKENLERSDKFFYIAIMKLRRNNLVETHNRHLFSAPAYEKFKEALDNGEIPDLKPPPTKHNSPMANAIEEIMRDYPDGAPSKDIIAALKRNPEFEAAINANDSFVYNVLKRMIETGSLRREVRKEGSLYILNHFDDSLQSEASNDQAEFELMADAALLQMTGARH